MTHIQPGDICRVANPFGAPWMVLVLEVFETDAGIDSVTGKTFEAELPEGKEIVQFCMLSPWERIVDTDFYISKEQTSLPYRLVIHPVMVGTTIADQLDKRSSVPLPILNCARNAPEPRLMKGVWAREDSRPLFQISGQITEAAIQMLEGLNPEFKEVEG